MKINQWIKNLLSKKNRKKLNKQQKKKIADIYKIIEGAELTEAELRGWLGDATTLKMLKILKAHYKQYCNGIIVENLDETDLHIARGICRAFNHIINLLEETALNQGDLEALILTYIENRNE